MASKLRNLILNPRLPPQTLVKGYASQQGSTLPANLKKNYEKFQRDDGVPVYLKGGVGDRLLLGFTLLVLATGLVNTAYTILRLDKKH